MVEGGNGGFWGIWLARGKSKESRMEKTLFHRKRSPFPLGEGKTRSLFHQRRPASIRKVKSMETKFGDLTVKGAGRTGVKRKQMLASLLDNQSGLVVPLLNMITAVIWNRKNRREKWNDICWIQLFIITCLIEN